jgi:hypothetical protein
MKVFEVSLSYGIIGRAGFPDTRFHFNEESAAQDFFRWLSSVYGTWPAFGIRLKSEVELEVDFLFDKAELTRREMVWEHWHKCHNGPQVIH